MTEIPRECARLAAELRTLRDRHRLTLSVLAAESTYSKSSWQRYLTARTLAPWPAVRTLCRLANEPEPRLRALWELAESSWAGRGAVAPATSRAPVPAPVAGSSPRVRTHDGRAITPPAEATTDTETRDPTPRHGRKWRTGAAASAAVTLLVVLITLTANGWGSTGQGAEGTAPSTRGFRVGCSGVACDGHDPGQELCGVQPQTLLHIQTPTGVGMEIRYNPLCRAAWARVWNAAAGDRLTLATPGRPAQSVTVADLGKRDPFIYTDLIATSGKATRLKACLTSPGAGDPAQCYSVSPP
ncbi:DUF2690 domain-containing protein [Streptomyces sp. MBT65]|uniref:helix-turn-helix domain-containing protein n=1 Tax=Streptomyces sp. MBT65 TaxID=1488395 RepID=UPI00190B6570|nr:XRE family transcriptional regulator [Streptomyces sp. MBT65]MBK3573473.1 DUF2690 domain-containing protein [Streptomyces sp. MBT65]